MEIGYTHFTGFEDSGVCWWCGGDLPKRKRRWCCEDHKDSYWETYNWRSASLACSRRNNNTCENCHKHESYGYGKPLVRLEAHHIIPIGGEDRSWHELNKPDNLLCLCHECHLEVHRVMSASKGKPEKMDDWEYAKIIGQGVFDLAPAGKG